MIHIVDENSIVNGSVDRGVDPLVNSNLSEDEQLYKENILDHFKHPRNKRTIVGATCTHAGKNPLCGDAIVVQLVVNFDNNIIEDIAFTGTGCAVSQAAISILSEEIKGLSVDTIKSLSSEDIVKMLGIPIGPVRMKCALLGLRTTQEALNIIGDDVHVKN